MFAAHSLYYPEYRNDFAQTLEDIGNLSSLQALTPYAHLP